MTYYTPQLAMDFWIEFNNHFLWFSTPELKQTMGPLFANGEMYTYFQLQNALENGQFPKSFANYAEQYRDNLATIFNDQDQILNKYFGDSTMNQQRAFEDFGQGTLYDVRREKKDPFNFWPVHSMDADYANNQPPVGYYSWYSFLRAYTVLNNITDGKWLTLATHIALGAAVQNNMKPKGIEGGVKENPNNPPIGSDVLEEFRNKYLPMNFEALDQAFISDDDLGPRPRKPKFA